MLQNAINKNNNNKYHFIILALLITGIFLQLIDGIFKHTFFHVVLWCPFMKVR